jgi:hypothetical protein
MENVDWDDIADSIAHGEAVLVLGPDAIPFYRSKPRSEAGSEAEAEEDESTFSRLMRTQILQALQSGVVHYFPKDNFMQFSGAAAKNRAHKEVRRLAETKEWVPDHELLRQIVAIPFPLVININPDKFLYRAFSQYWREPQFDYFTTKDKPVQPDIKPLDGQNNPLVYQLCGSVLDKRDSIILDYNDLFYLLKNLLMDNGISEQITRKLQDADRFILLGFELERWYFQLFLHYINRIDTNTFENTNENFSIYSQVSEDNRTFIVEQFNLRHIAPSRNDFEALYQACANRGILRELNDPASPAEVQIRQLVVSNKYEEAFQTLADHLAEEQVEVDLAQLRSRYNALIEQERAGTIAQENLNLEMNRIRYALLSFAHQLSTSDE